MNSLTSTRKPLSQFSRTLYIAFFSTSSSSSSSSSSYSSLYRRYDDDNSRNVKVSVWWDIENIGVPSGCNVFKIAQSIIAAVRANGIKGPVQISAFGDVLCLTKPNQEALCDTGINLVHVPQGGRNSADRSLLVDIMHWATQNPPPAHIFLISSDRDFAGILHKLRMNNYNILLAGREGNSPGVLCSAATIMWHWDDLIKGENLSGRHFNQPPDGPLNSWYGHYKGPLEDPYDVPQQLNTSRANDSTNVKQRLDPRPLQVPKEVIKHLRDIVRSYPRGILISQLRSQLESRMTLDKSYYGFKKFSSLLFSMSHIVKVFRADGSFLICPVSCKASEAVENDDNFVGPITGNGKQTVEVTPNADGESQSTARMVNVEPILHVSYHDVAKAEEKVEKTPEKVLDDPAREVQFNSAKEDDEKEVADAQLVRSPRALLEEQNPKSEVGVFERLRTLWFGSGTGIEKAYVNVADKFYTSTCNPENSTTGEMATKVSMEHEIPCPSSALNVDSKRDKIAESSVSPGFIGKVICWFRSWRNRSLVSSPIERLNEEQIVIDDSRKHEDDPQSKKHELFFKDTFWSAFASFLRTYRGSDIILNSTSREQLAKRLQTDGPLVLRSLKESDLLDLVDLLITEKKWIKEFPTQIPRFRIFPSLGKRPDVVQSSTFNASNEKPQSVLFTIMQNRPAEKSRSEILVDCQKLLDELLQQNPEGFNISIFKQKFVEKYGYILDHQKLSYTKLVSLLQIMPGVKLDSFFAYPDNVVYAPGIASLGSEKSSPDSDCEMSDSPQNDEDAESRWEDLGPVANSNITRQKEPPGPSMIDQEYRPSMVDDNDKLSDLEEVESSPSSQLKTEQQTKKVKEEDSSLLQILDSWHGTKDENSTEGLVDCSEKETQFEPSPAASNTRKQRPQKSYTFVSNSLESSKDNLIDGILGSLKNSGKSSLQQ